MPLVENKEPMLSVEFAKRLLSTRFFWGFCVLWALGNCSEAESTQSLLSLYMQGHPERGYTVVQINNWPTGVQAIGVVSMLTWAIATDIWGGRWVSGYYVAATCVGNAVIILVPSSTTATFAAYYWAGSIYCIQATFFSWANESMRNQSPSMRAAVLACMNSAGNCFQVWWPLIFYRADDAPEFTVSL